MNEDTTADKATETLSEGDQSPEQKKRTRRSKAEMEADKDKDQKQVDKYLVSLLHHADMEIEASEAEEAVEAFKKYYGILASINPFKVVKKGD